MDQPPSPSPYAEVSVAQVRPSVPWDWSDILLWLLLGLLGALVAANLVAVALYFAGHHDVEHDPWIAFAAQVTLYLAALGILFLLLRFRRHATPAALGWRIPPIKWLAIAIGAVPVALALAAVIVYLLGIVFPSVVNPQCSAAQSAFGSAPVLGYIAIAVVAPIVEETVFRGFIYAWLRAHMDLNLAMLLGAFIFGLAHAATGIPIIFVIPLTAIGLVLVWLYQKSGSVVPGMVTHGGFNLVNAVFILQGNC